MGIEIERKFLLQDDAWRAEVRSSTRMIQGYLVHAAALAQGLARCSVRVRVAGDRAWLNAKAAMPGIERSEFEVPLPVADAESMLRQFCDGRVEKLRHLVDVDGHTFEIDEFMGDNQGLVVAELELSAADAPFPQPDWLGREVSDMPRYYNVQLIDHPFRDWSAAERAGEPAPC
ncbi:MAG TPA: CYTH domain-containing protein [Rhodanobacteraceae bacterium]|nr:CYTH domain-containing protein [Rhodanobacteraceae bacterium]